MVTVTDEVYLAHYGILRKSGRYPWGSGGNQSTRNKLFLDYIQDLRREGMSETDIAKGVGISTTQLRAAKSIAKNQQKQEQIIMAQRLKDKGYSNGAIAERMGLPGESSVRSLLAPGAKDKAENLLSVAGMLKDAVDEKGLIDIGSGVEAHIGVSKEKLAAAAAILEEQGYAVHRLKNPQVTTGHDTEYKVLAPPGTTQKEAWLNRYNIQQIQAYSDDGGRTFLGIQTPLSVDPKRLEINYADTGGDKADGVIFVRPGVDDITLGKSRYAQVRVQVGDGHYLKGMAMYKDDLPDGVDLMFNTNKKKAEAPDKLDALKPISDDPDNPFGAVIRRQIGEKDANGKVTKVTSAMNIVNEEGDWEMWSKNIASQVLSKQSPSLAKSQLSMTFENRQMELDRITSLTNPVVRKKLLEEFADGVDAASVHLKAAKLPRQGWHAILPMNSIKPNEIYAPNFEPGETVVLIRYPHGGTFEIPKLTVNNRHKESKRVLGDARDAVAIHHSVAERLSGADFDGDTVLVIPNNRGLVKDTPALEGLKGFDPRASYPGYEGMKKMTNTQNEMGQISNLITDMTIRKASSSDIARAVRHSMVVIDAEKKGLNYKQSEIDNGIRQLKEKYQSSPEGGTGASTLISRAKSKTFVPDRKERPASQGGPIDPITGKRVYVETGKINYRTGKPKLLASKKLAETDDAHTLSSGTPMERLYADHSNRLKNMANQARLEILNTPRLVYSPSAKKAYESEVASLNSKLALAIRNRPLERQANLLANSVINAKRAANPDMDQTTLKKIKYQAIEEMRTRTGAKKQQIEITPTEWQAIQAGAISNHKLSQILDNADMDIVRDLATPPQKLLMTPAKTARAKRMLASGYTRGDIAQALGVSVTTLDESTIALSSD